MGIMIPMFNAVVQVHTVSLVGMLNTQKMLVYGKTYSLSFPRMFLICVVMIKKS